MASVLDTNRAVNRAFQLLLNEYGVDPGVAGGYQLTEAIAEALPTQTGHSGEFLTTDGSTASWVANATGFTIGNFSGTSTAKGLDVTADVLTLHAADGTNPGAVSTSAQTFAGAKTFSNGVLTNSVGASSASVVAVNGAPTDASNAVGVQLGSSTTLAVAGAKLAQFKNNTTEKAFVALNGDFSGNGAALGNNSATGGQFGLWLGATNAGTPSVSNYSISYFAGALSINADSGSSVFLRVANGTAGLEISGTTATLTVPVTTASTSLDLSGNMADGASAIGVKLRSNVAYANATSKLVSIQNDTTEKAYFNKDGNLYANTALVLLGTGNTYPGLWLDATAVATPTTNNFTVIKAAGDTYVGADTGKLIIFQANGTNTAKITPSGGSGIFSADIIKTLNSSEELDIAGLRADGAAAIAVKIRSNATYANATAKIFSIQNNTTEKLAVDLNGKFIVNASGGAAVAGTATLVNGTVTVSTTSVTATSKIFALHNTVIGTPGILSAPDASIVAGTSFVIDSSTGALDDSTVNWWIIN